jgi:hypothetical protein
MHHASCRYNDPVKYPQDPEDALYVNKSILVIGKRNSAMNTASALVRTAGGWLGNHVGKAHTRTQNTRTHTQTMKGVV